MFCLFFRLCDEASENHELFHPLSWHLKYIVKEEKLDSTFVLMIYALRTSPLLAQIRARDDPCIDNIVMIKGQGAFCKLP